MHWTEPRQAALARAKFWNPPALIVRLWWMLTSLVFVSFSVVFLIAFRFQTGAWLWFNAFALGGISGVLIGAFNAVLMLPALKAKRGKIELRAHEFWTRGDRDFTVPYRELRGYSMMVPGSGIWNGRTLLLFPAEGDGHFSIGIPDAIPDEAIRAVLDGQVPFVTYIDEQALKNPWR